LVDGFTASVSVDDNAQRLIESWAMRNSNPRHPACKRSQTAV